MNPSDHGVRDFVSSLHCTVTSQQRRNLLNHLLNQFHVSQDPVALSQSLVTAGFVHGLVLHLGFVLSSHPQDAEIICQALASVYHHCPESMMEASVQDAPDLMPLLIRSSVLGQHNPINNNNDNDNNNNSQLLQAIFSIWHSCSSSAKLSFFLMREQGSFALLPAIVHILRQRPLLRHDEQVELLGCLKNLSYFAEEEQRSQMVQQPGLLAMLIQFSSHQQAVIDPYHDDNNVEDDDETTGKIPERLSAVFRNLALQPNTRQILSQQPDFIGALLRLATNFTDHHHHRQIVILRNVLNTLQSLALEEDSCVALVLYGDGMVLDMLHRLLNFQTPRSHQEQHHYQHHDDDTTIRKRTARIARLLTSSTRVVHMIVYHVGLMETLLCSALQDASRQVRMDATKSLCHCASVLQASMHPQLIHVLDGLASLLDGRVQIDATSLDRPDEVEKVALVVRACQELAANPYNRLALVKQRRLLERLASVAMTSSSSSGPILEFELDQPHLLPLLPTSREDSSVRADIVYTFYHLSQESAVQAHLIAIPAVIQSLVWNAQSPTAAATNNPTAVILTAEQRRRRDYAIATLVHLASNDANRAALVSYSGLLPVLIHFAATAQQQQQQQQQHDPRQPHRRHHHQQQQQQDACTHANKASVKSTIMQLVAVL